MCVHTRIHCENRSLIEIVLQTVEHSKPRANALSNYICLLYMCVYNMLYIHMYSTCVLCQLTSCACVCVYSILIYWCTCTNVWIIKRLSVCGQLETEYFSVAYFECITNPKISVLLIIGYMWSAHMQFNLYMHQHLHDVTILIWHGHVHTDKN